MDTVSWELVREMTSGDFLFLCKAFWMEAASEGRLANWWNTLRLRMIAYTRLQFPGGETKRDRFTTSKQMYKFSSTTSISATAQKKKGKIFRFTRAQSFVKSQIIFTVKLVLDYIVESLKKEEHKVMVLGCREQEPAGGEGLQQVEQFIGCHHGQALQVRRHCRRRRNV